jgi:hypothetical protein
MSQTTEELYNLDAATFQKPLIQVAEVLAQKVKREAPRLLVGPNFVSVDLHVLMRQTMHTYDLLFYLNADERRETDCYWRAAYSIVTLPLIRNMIDCLYNITAILEDPAGNGTWFRKSGFRKALAAFEKDEDRYGGRPEWDRWIAKGREMLDLQIRACGLTMSDVLAQKSSWPTLGQYISNKQPGGIVTANQDFLKTFTYGQWSEYSAMAHGAFEGLMPVAMYYIADSVLHEDRPKMDAVFPRILCLHIARAAVILLCIVTELQAHFHFDGANIDERIHKMWGALMPVFEVKELYNERYSQLMRDKNIHAGCDADNRRG